jgi:integrase
MVDHGLRYWLWQEHWLVFPSRIGTPMEPNNLRRSWSRIRAAAGLEGVRLHDTRHTCVSLLLALGVPPNIVREIVGHNDIEVTMTISRWWDLNLRPLRPELSADSRSDPRRTVRDVCWCAVRAGGVRWCCCTFLLYRAVHSAY